MDLRPVPVLVLLALACCACSGRNEARVVVSPIHTGTTPLDRPRPPRADRGVTILSVLMDDDGGLTQSLPSAINDFRRAHGLHPLAVARQLTRAADAHAHALAYAGMFQHEWPDGRRFDQWIRTYYKPPRHGYWSVGENLLGARGRRARCRPRRRSHSGSRARRISRSCLRLAGSRSGSALLPRPTQAASTTARAC